MCLGQVYETLLLHGLSLKGETSTTSLWPAVGLYIESYYCYGLWPGRYIYTIVVKLCACPCSYLDLRVAWVESEQTFRFQHTLVRWANKRYMSRKV